MANEDQVGGLIRAVVAFAGGYFVSKGYISSDLLMSISSALVTVLIGAWSLISNRSGKVIGATTVAATTVTTVPTPKV